MRTTITSSFNITRREQEILNLISREYTAPEIAQELFLSKHTVVSHRKNLLEKLKARNSAGLIRRAFELGLLQIAVTAA